MAQLGYFNPNEVQDEQREVLPPGQYIAQIVESDLVPLKSGNGQMLKLTFEILDGPLAKRRVWENLNIQHQNSQAQDIAQRALKRICTAVGHNAVLTDSEDLHFKPMRIRIAVEEDKSGQYGPQNRVKGYDPIAGGPAPQPPQQRQAAPQPAPQPSYATASGGGYQAPQSAPTGRPWGGSR